MMKWFAAKHFTEDRAQMITSEKEGGRRRRQLAQRFWKKLLTKMQWKRNLQNVVGLFFWRLSQVGPSHRKVCFLRKKMIFSNPRLGGCTFSWQAKHNIKFEHLKKINYSRCILRQLQSPKRSLSATNLLSQALWGGFFFWRTSAKFYEEQSKKKGFAGMMVK